MNYPCGIIEDLLPLYIDDVCNEESKQAVHNHLTECEKCRNCYEAMKSTDGVTRKRKSNTEDNIIANSLKNVKKRINRKIRNVVLCATAAVLIVMYGFSLLFNIPIKNISPADISVTAHVYPLSEIIDNSTNDVTNSDMVTIFSDENDRSERIKVNIPGIGMVVLTKDTIEKCQYATVISFCSEYFIKAVEIGSGTEDNTMYISAFKTTLLNNKAQDYQQQMHSLDLQEINRIVFVNSDGTETVLWGR